MTLARDVADYIASRPDRSATRADLRAAFHNHPRLGSALSNASRNGWIRWTGVAWRHTGADMRRGERANAAKGSEGYDQQYELARADAIFKKRIGSHRYEDVPTDTQLRAMWRHLPPARDGAVGCSAALLVGYRLR